MTIEIPSRNLAEYLHASGVHAIAIVKSDRAHRFQIARDLGKLAMSLGDSDIVAAYWTLDRSQAARVMRDAARIAGTAEDELCAVAALGSAALINHVPLTAHETVLARAERASKRLDDQLCDAAQIGGLQGFNAEFKRRRLSASVHGTGFMNYATAWRRFRRVMIGRLIVSGTTPHSDNLFREVFCE